MKTKLIISLSIPISIVIVKMQLFVVSVATLCLIDIAFGLFLVFFKKQESFNGWRLLEGVFKLMLYVVAIFLSYIIDVAFFNEVLLDIQNLLPKVVSGIFIYLELESIEKKRVIKLGKKPVKESVRGVIKTGKEFYKSIVNFKNVDS